MTCFEVVYYYVWFLYAGQWVVKYYQHFLHVPVLRIPTVESFLVVFSIDFFYREILCWGYIVDPLQICFRYSTLSERSRGAYANTILAVLSTVVGCGLTFGLTASLSRALPRLFPKPDWAAWDLELHSNSMVSCFLAEFCLTGIHYAMTVQTIVLNSLVNQQHTVSTIIGQNAAHDQREAPKHALLLFLHRRGTYQLGFCRYQGRADAEPCLHHSGRAGSPTCEQRLAVDDYRSPVCSSIGCGSGVSGSTPEDEAGLRFSTAIKQTSKFGKQSML